jgi:hypothetical protein
LSQTIKQSERNQRQFVSKPCASSSIGHPRFGPVNLCKVDIADGFYRIEVRPADIPKLGVIIPSRTEDQEQRIAFPLVLPMGWKNSPPYFCAITETVADVTNERIRHHQQPPRHRLERVADSHGIGEDDQQTCSAEARTPTTAVPAPAPALPPSGPSEHPVNQQLGQFDIYVDDFLGIRATHEGSAVYDAPWSPR